MDAFRRGIETHFSFLRELGYGEPEFSSEKFPIVGDILRATYHSPDREIVVGLVKDVRPFITVDVIRLPRRTVADDLEVALYVRERHPDLAESVASAEEKAADVESLARGVLPIYSSLLAKELRDIVTGDRWEKGFFTDWTL